MQAILTAQSVEDAYWDVLAAREALRISQLAFERAEELLELNKQKVELGTLAPIEITEAEEGVASQVEAVIVDVRPRASLIRRAKRYKLNVLFSKFLRILYLRLIRDDREAHSAMERVLGKSHVEEFARKDLVRELRGVNSRACAEVLARIAPDAILVFGTSIVRDRILVLAADVAFNMHTGISPIYRGSDCTFWPM